MAEKIELSPVWKSLYAPPAKEPVLVDVPPQNFVLLDGHGNPNDNPAYAETLQTLYSISYTLKFAVKKTQGMDYRVFPLEGLWWTPDMADFSTERKEDWDWTMMIAQPDFVTPDQVEAACAELSRKKDLPLLARARFETYHEGLSVQVMHLGPYSAEGPTVALLHAFAEAQGCDKTGKHHEIYLGDPRRAAPEKLKTILRQPVKRRG